MLRLFIRTSGIWLLLNSCQAGKEPYTTSPYNARIFQTEIDQFGYDIYKDSVLLIHQPIVPVIQGNKGFKTQEEAASVAALVIQKLEQGIMPPALTMQEMDSLHITTPP
jgi:CTP synthase (UTP-ammonia lyase)